MSKRKFLEEEDKPREIYLSQTPAYYEKNSLLDEAFFGFDLLEKET